MNDCKTLLDAAAERLEERGLEGNAEPMYSRSHVSTGAQTHICGQLHAIASSSCVAAQHFAYQHGIAGHLACRKLIFLVTSTSCLIDFESPSFQSLVR